MNIHALYSTSRLGFDDWYSSVLNMLQALRMNITKCKGAYWEQGITNGIEDVLAFKPEYILTMDGDSWFLPGHIIMLHNLMKKYPEYDCIVPLQVRRNSNDPLFMLADESGQDKKLFNIQEIRQRKEVLPLNMGHFGLTLFKSECFSKIEKPWFWSQPNSSDDWKDGKTDADVRFWKQFKKAGLKVGLATNVFIGHLQLVCTFPDVVEHGHKAIHVMLDESKLNIPVHCVPSVIEGIV